MESLGSVPESRFQKNQIWKRDGNDESYLEVFKFDSWNRK